MNGREPEVWLKMLNRDLEESDQQWVLRTWGSQLLGVVSAKYYHA